MSTITCPFCQHENSSGTRFCSDCGSSIYLKICPSPECGKISHIDALVCETCGQPFPNKNPVQNETANVEETVKHKEQGSRVSLSDNEKPRTSALPLIMMALVAGGLPMLWINRAHLPTPKTWQPSSSEVTKAEPITSTPPPPVAVPPPPSASVNSLQSSAPDKTAPPDAIVSSESSSTANKTEDNKKSSKNQQVADNTSKRNTKTPRPKTSETPSPKSPETSTPCTEATIALGLCNAKQTTK